MGKTNTLVFNDFRQGFIVLEQGLEGFCNQYLATKTMNTVRTIIEGYENFSGNPYYEPLVRFMILVLCDCTIVIACGCDFTIQNCD